MNNYNFIQDTGQSKTFGFSPAMTGSFAAGNVIGGANPILISTPNQSMQGQLLGMQSAIGNQIDPATGRPASPSSRVYQNQQVPPDRFYNRFGGFRAEGGPVEEGKSYIVGEDGVEYYVDEDGNRVPVGLLGAELIEAPKDGFIVPNQDSQGFSNALLGQVTSTTPSGPQSAFLPSGEKAVYAMTPEELAARQAGRGQIESVPGLFGQVGQTLSNLFVQPMVNSAETMRQGRKAKPFGTTPTAPTFDVGGRTTGRGRARRGADLTITAPQGLPTAATQSAVEPTQVPTIQSITETEQAQGQAPQPQATFTLPSGEVRSIMSGQDVASAFGRESGRPMTFQVDGGEVTVPSAQAIQTMNLGEQAAARQAQQEFLASPAAREMSNRMLRSVMYNDPYAQASAEREARLAAKPDFNRAVSDRERRGTCEMSRSEAIRIAEAQGYKDKQARDVADGYITLQRQGRDPITGQVVKDRGELTFDQKLAQNKFDFDVAKFSFEQEKEASDAATALRKSEEAAKYAVRDTLRQNENVMRKAQRAGQNIGLTTTGATGALFGMIPGTGAYDQKATIETLQADAAFSTLQRMRDASKTGGALGNVSERELDLLMGSVGNLKIGQSEEQFRNNLAEYVNLRNEALLNIYDAFAADYSPEAANEAFKINSREDLIPRETGSSQSRGTPVETQSGRYEVTTI